MPKTSLPVEAYRDLVARALAEDVGTGDVTSSLTIGAGQRARGVVLAKGALIVAGLDIAAETFRQCDAAAIFTTRRPDGTACDAGTIIAEVTGQARALLTAERTALNFLQRLSGIATETRRFVAAAAGRITVLDTRKTTPTFRDLEKYAVRCGGGTNHRQRLDAGILIKDNHKRLAGGIAAVMTALATGGREFPRLRSGQVGPAAPPHGQRDFSPAAPPHGQRDFSPAALPHGGRDFSTAGQEVEIEVETLAELDEALAAGATRVLVDNFSLEDQREAVRRSKGRAVVEISGGVTLERLPDIASTGADFVSVGALTHSVRAVDISFELEPIA
jgi:nicotinate-nucleotide pyrophosphorylase (carboxylating)